MFKAFQGHSKALNTILIPELDLMEVLSLVLFFASRPFGKDPQK